MEVKYVKLVTGHDLLTSELQYLKDSDEFQLKQPALIQLMPTEEGAQISLSPWPPFGPDNDDEIIIKNEHILVMCDAEESLVSGYTEYVTGIAVVPKVGLITP